MWTGSVNLSGYGQFDGTGAHRWSWTIYRGPLPVHPPDHKHAGKVMPLDHLCRVRCCVNPDHLEPVTHAENIRRGVGGRGRGDQQQAKTHCPYGHPYDAANTRYDKRGGRSCRECHRISAQIKYLRITGRLQLSATEDGRCCQTCGQLLQAEP